MPDHHAQDVVVGAVFARTSDKLDLAMGWALREVEKASIEGLAAGTSDYWLAK